MAVKYRWSKDLGWHDKRVEIIRALLEEGRTYQEIGSLLGVSRQRVFQIASGVGLRQPQRNGPKKWSLYEAVRLTQIGHCALDISRRMGVGCGTISTTLRRHGISPLKRMPRWDVERARELREAGLSWVSIASEFGVHYNAVREYFKRHGLDMRRGLS
ncbi:MAG: hypothetical protein HY912_23270 [Desulfomonile tiedjei]|uniref:RNA polymerase sigma-70 region 4 domain-containing protein n=1 Tax=Desulfomonile tiedjei TaxID=2358 RepID=A0A9D6V5E0_9BACT|nr:hypothetical protein [Desulfomonile tiedjei]